MVSFYDQTAELYVQYYIDNGIEATYDFIFSTQVSLSVLTGLYDKFVNDGIDSIDKLPEEKRAGYWSVASKYYQGFSNRMKAAKATYVLDLILNV